jgi:hypothetical protein
MGRFAYLYGSDGTVSIVAPRMDGFKPHLATLSIASRFVLFGEDHALRVVAIPGEKASTFMTWDLTGVDVEFGDYKANTVTRDLPGLTRGSDVQGVPDLVELARIGDAPRIKSSVLARQLAPETPVTTRVTIGGGSLAPVQTVTSAEAEFFAFRTFDDRTPVAVGDQSAVRLADAMQWTGETVGPEPGVAGPGKGLTIVLRTFDGKSARKIVCAPDSDLLIGFTHTCNCLGDIDRDTEFAAYYVLLETPPDLAARSIPVLRPPQAGFICSSSPDCQGFVAASL